MKHATEVDCCLQSLLLFRQGASTVGEGDGAEDCGFEFGRCLDDWLNC